MSFWRRPKTFGEIPSPGRAIHPGERCNRPNSAYRDRVHWWDRRDHHLPVAAPKEEKGWIALDLAVHHTDLISYLAGGFDHAFGGTFIAHEVRRKRAAPELDLESYRVRHQAMPSLVTATGDDSIIATFRMKSGLIAQYTLILAGPSRPPTLTVQGRDGSVALPLDASTGALAVTSAMQLHGGGDPGIRGRRNSGLGSRQPASDGAEQWNPRCSADRDRIARLRASDTDPNGPGSGWTPGPCGRRRRPRRVSVGEKPAMPCG